MTPEEKELLIKDLCARLPYGIKCKLSADGVSLVEDLQLAGLSQFLYGRLDVIPYLRPMSSMTQEEIDEYDSELDKDLDIVMNGALDKDRHITSDGKHNFSKNFVAHFGNDWLNKNMFDYRGLIEKGLALEATKDMYKTE